MTDDLVAKLRDEDSYYRLQEKHWCIDAEELERQRLTAADRIEALEAENERLREAISWIEPPFMDDKTPESELRSRIEFCVADAKRAALGEKQ